MFGTADSVHDIAQGVLGDCYFLAGSSAVAEIDERFKKNFLTPDKNAAGIYAFNFWIRGIPTLFVVDDNLPWDANNNELQFSKVGLDGSLWGPLVEKAWAKAMGTYEAIGNGGVPNEAISFFTNVPITTYELKNLNVNSLW